tara:strand:- start:528 stop:902 length:375 start_codon:yes stop_codon:yes gene_type:complete
MRACFLSGTSRRYRDGEIADEGNPADNVTCAHGTEIPAIERVVDPVGEDKNFVRSKPGAAVSPGRQGTSGEILMANGKRRPIGDLKGRVVHADPITGEGPYRFYHRYVTGQVSAGRGKDFSFYG